MRWPFYKHILFDCDSTLTTVEGIDILAEFAGKKQSVEEMTNAAMNGQLDLEDVYGERLQVVAPTRRQIKEVHRVYKKNKVADAAEVISVLQALGHETYIISGGLAEPVEEFGVHLGVPRAHIRAVGVAYDELAGVWWQDPKRTGGLTGSERYAAYEQSRLTISDGKGHIVRELLGNQPGQSLLIGDGMSDLLAGSAVDLFVGYGGVVAREQVMAQAPVFLHSESLAPLLALATGPAVLHRLLDSPHTEVANRSFELMATGAITFNDDKLKRKFNRAYNAAINSPR